ncbi:outer membrane protein transport protein [Salibaculum halophilum]|uniref:outer membrane protein transport protein n=1 Tax=Salibaculum halophilum TaxID=1914408 RepID=UPI000A1040BC|nr:outer membrane protein transport protein [Salibaculum halophilum]
MNKILGAGAALLMTTGLASAGGLDRSGQPVGAIFEEGSYAELSFGLVNPSVSGNMSSALPSILGGGAPSGDMAPSYAQFGAAYKTDLFEGTALAIILDQPYGADVDYDDTTAYALAGAKAEVDTTGLTVLLRFRIDENFSLHGGVRTVTASGVYDVPAVPDLDGPQGPATASSAYASTYSSDTGMGYVLGGAYERPDIALRVALTYSSPVDLALDGSVGDLSTTMPESVNLDVQTGIAQDTLLFGSVRYVAWDGFALTDSRAGDILDYDDDVYTYTLGVGRQFTDKLSASFSVGYEESTGEPTGNLGPTDGYVSYQLGAAYMIADGVELSGGIRYIDIGDATTTIGSDFSDNSAVGLGAKVAYSY